MLHEGNNCLTSTNTWPNSAVVSSFIIVTCFPKYRIVLAKCSPAFRVLGAIFGGKFYFQHQMPEIQIFKAPPRDSPTRRSPSAYWSHEWSTAPKYRSLLWRTRPWPRLQPGTDALGGDSPSSPYACTALLRDVWDQIKALFLCLGFLCHFPFLVLQSCYIVSGNNFLWPLF